MDMTVINNSSVTQQKHPGWDLCRHWPISFFVPSCSSFNITKQSPTRAYALRYSNSSNVCFQYKSSVFPRCQGWMRFALRSAASGSILPETRRGRSRTRGMGTGTGTGTWRAALGARRRGSSCTARLNCGGIASAFGRDASKPFQATQP